ncbi:GNAT family N-acetyltransferase [Sphingoaurantiacus capsulatus]|uniref:GNAT family N-acetyltransferase n=1 Tax=Sphingoaurantiacus capsulatus TaxID=1771310 RepID=A0ABV7X763_9SPHN
MTHPLDRPVWSTLTTRHAALAVGDARAWRIDPTVGPFAAAADASPENLSALAALLPADEEFWLVEGEALPLPPGVRVTREAALDQMVAEAVAPPTATFEIIPLGDADAPEMLALATLTQPGPFRDHTHRLGGFVGVKEEGRLVAMAGQRMKVPGFTEVSGVCTHPDHRGRGYAAQLMRAVGGAIVARGEAAFLHVYPTNEGAIALYKTLGFRRRRGMDMQIVMRG